MVAGSYAGSIDYYDRNYDTEHAQRLAVAYSHFDRGESFYSLLTKLLSYVSKLLIAWPDCFAILWSPPIFGWYLSSTSTLMIASWTLHNIIAWKKSKPFLERVYSNIYIGTIALAQVYWILEIYANFAYFNGINETLFPKTRPYEALCR